MPIPTIKLNLKDDPTKRMFNTKDKNMRINLNYNGSKSTKFSNISNAQSQINSSRNLYTQKQMHDPISQVVTFDNDNFKIQNQRSLHGIVEKKADTNEVENFGEAYKNHESAKEVCIEASNDKYSKNSCDNYVEFSQKFCQISPITSSEKK